MKVKCKKTPAGYDADKTIDNSYVLAWVEIGIVFIVKCMVWLMSQIPVYRLWIASGVTLLIKSYSAVN